MSYEDYIGDGDDNEKEKDIPFSVGPVAESTDLVLPSTHIKIVRGVEFLEDE